MQTIDENKILKKAIAFYGETLQKVVACEEMSELIKEITKSIRGKNNRKEMIEEISDVIICLDQLKIMFNISDQELKDEVVFKLVRLNGRLNGEEI